MPRCVLITGGTRGIGGETARYFAANGDNVAMIYRSDKAAADAQVAALCSLGIRAAAYKADLTDSVAVSATLAQLLDDFGRLDVLVNNAGIFARGPFMDIDKTVFDSVFHTNVLAPLATIQACLPYFGEGGRVVNVISTQGLAPRAINLVYSASKAALRAVTQGLVSPLGERGVTINCVAPGMVLTEMIQDLPQETLDAGLAETPLGRLADPADIACVIYFLASHEARWITGRTIVADGGRLNY